MASTSPKAVVSVLAEELEFERLLTTAAADLQSCSGNGEQDADDSGVGWAVEIAGKVEPGEVCQCASPGSSEPGAVEQALGERSSSNAETIISDKR